MYLAHLTTLQVAEVLALGKPVAILLPVGSVEPHGPHLPLSTDTIISQKAAEMAVPLLAEKGVMAYVAPAIPYGVTDFAEGFAGAITLAPNALTAFLRAVVNATLSAGFHHVCLVNNHLEPAHDAAVRASVDGLPKGRASVACPLTRKWARTLNAEFKSGACHAGQYETSLVLAAAPELVDVPRAQTLEPVAVSLSDGIRAGKNTFRAMGMNNAYAGSPANASVEDGLVQYKALANMIAGEVTDSLQSLSDVP